MCNASHAYLAITWLWSRQPRVFEIHSDLLLRNVLCLWFIWRAIQPFHVISRIQLLIVQLPYSAAC